MRITFNPKQRAFALFAFVFFIACYDQVALAQRFRVAPFAVPFARPVALPARPVLALPVPPIPRPLATRALVRGPILGWPLRPVARFTEVAVETPTAAQYAAPAIPPAIPSIPAISVPAFSVPAFPVPVPVPTGSSVFQIDFPGGSFRAQSGIVPVDIVRAGTAPIDVVRAGNVSTQAASPTDLATAAEQLQVSLSTIQSDQAEVWLDYLAPGQVIDAYEKDDTTTLAQLLKHYDGVAANTDLSAISGAQGFATTRSLMRDVVGEPADISVMLDVARQPTPAAKPTPAEKPVPAEEVEEPAAEPSLEVETSPAETPSKSIMLPNAEVGLPEQEMVELPTPLPELDDTKQNGGSQ